MVKQTFDPILESGNYINKLFSKIPVPKTGMEIILFATSSGKKLFISKDPDIGPKKIYKGKYDKKIVVDVRAQTVSFCGMFQSKDIGVEFEIEVNASVKVTEPDIVWEMDVHDVAQILEREMNPKISNVASMYSCDDVRILQQDLGNAIGELFLTDIGISIQGISYIVKLEKAHEELIKKTSYERQRARAGKEISEIYENNNILSVFAEVADGSLGLEEAMRLARKNLSSDFDERMRQIREVRKFVEETRNSNLADHDQLMEQMDKLWQSLPFTGSAAQNKLNSSEKVEKLEQSSRFAPMD